MNLSDSMLVRLTLEGHKEAFAELVLRHQDRVFGFALQMTRNPADAADLAQEAFVRAFRKLATFKPDHTFHPWIMSICANLVKNRFRGETRRRAAEETHLDLEQASAPAPADPRREAVDQALWRLDEQDRVPLVLKHVDGLSYEDIARILHIGLSAAKMRVKRARDELVRLLSVEKEVPV